jgi:hypothetical protein
LPNKFFAKKVRTEYGTFDSMAEYRYWIKLNALRKADNDTERVTEIERQVIFPINVNGFKIGKYIADFRVTYADGRTEVVDIKNPYLLGKGSASGTAQLFNYKRKLVKALYNIDIIVIK